jgi:phage shock protein A
MSIFSRFTDIINSNLSSILDKAEDPEKMVRLIIQEMEETLVEVRTQSAKVIADKKEIGRRRERLQQDAVAWERKAEVALSKEREDLARLALKEKTQAIEAIEALSGDLKILETNLEKLGGDIGQLQQKLNDAKTRRKALIARSQTATSQLGVRRKLHSVDVDEAMNRFERYERKMDDLEGEVEAYDLGQKNLADEIADLEADEKVDEELSKLKSRLNSEQSE